MLCILNLAGKITAGQSALPRRTAPLSGAGAWDGRDYSSTEA